MLFLTVSPISKFMAQKYLNFFNDKALTRLLGLLFKINLIINKIVYKKGVFYSNTTALGFLFFWLDPKEPKGQGCHFSTTHYGAFSKPCKLVRLWRTSNSARFVPPLAERVHFPCVSPFRNEGQSCLRTFNLCGAIVQNCADRCFCGSSCGGFSCDKQKHKVGILH